MRRAEPLEGLVSEVGVTKFRRRAAALVFSVSAVVFGLPALASDYDSQYPTELEGVVALSSSNAWAVGFASFGQQALIYHWNGRAWSKVASPTTGQLNAVAGSSSSNVWAVGGYTAPHTHSTQTLVLHWNGSQWSRVSSPSPSSLFNPLLGVAALSASNAWAVGYYVNPANASQHYALALHWNGTKWARVAVPGHELYGVAATSSTNVWAAGLHTIQRWNGSKWVTQYSNAGERIFGISALSPTNAWAVGDLATANDGKATVVLHWNGTRWTRVASPNPTHYNTLTSVRTVSSANIWAVGCHGANVACSANDTLILHWNGTKWTKVASPHPGAAGDRLGSVSAHTGGDLWAVGGAATSNQTAILILHWNGTRWTSD